MVISLSQINFFHKLSEPNLLLLTTSISEKQISKGRALWREGDRVEKVWVIKDGIVKITKRSYNHQPLLVQLCSEADIVYLSGSLSESNYSCEARALVPSVLWAIPLTVFREIFKPKDIYHSQIIKELTKQLECSYQLGVLHTRHADDRVSQILLDLKNKLGKTIKVTHEDIASLTGLSRETVSRSLTQLQKQGTIRLSNGSIFLHKI